ncbi:MAG TPA: NERD domain-containing protein/DEAD/DEAH box helicase [Chitinophagaceae bacterium]|nr:NERD domain-containing protein/DEAD/DEAH box helicase [Chitinophagaceae bacterium]
MTVDDFKPGTQRKFSNGEFLVYQEFEELTRQEGLFCIYSYRLEYHSQKRQGEIDYLIFSPDLGILVLEVKGSKIKKDPNGHYFCFDRSVSQWKSMQDPFKQAEENCFSLQHTLKDTFHMLRKRPLVSWGCIFPENELLITGLDYPRWRYLDHEQFITSLYPSLQAIPVQEKRKSSQRFDKLSDLDILTLKRALIGEPFEGQLVALDLSKGLEQLSQLTSAQSKVLLDLSDNERVFFIGAAGTGKTFMALQEFKRLHSLQKTVGLVVTNENLRQWALSTLRPELGDMSPFVCTYDECSSKSIGPWDVLIIDEVQDLLFDGRLKALSPIVKGGLAQGHWRFFGDPLRQTLGHSPMDVKGALIQNGIDPNGLSFYRLRLNVRNTKRIIQGLKKAVDLSDTELLENDYTGEKIDLLIYEQGQLAEKINKEVHKFLNEGHPPHRISVIIPTDTLQKVSPSFTFPYYLVSDPSAFIGLKGITVGDEHEVKGLENDIVLYVLPEDGRSDAQRRMYIGMSRARLRLVTFCSLRNVAKYINIIKTEE